VQLSQPLPALIDAALGAALPADARLAVAVSGGPDSLGLLALTRASLPGRVTALTVNHGLRSGSAAEAEHVAALCRAADIPHHILVWPGPHPRRSVQAAARTARYTLMTAWCVANRTPYLLTAHHAEDQAETLLLRLARGSALAGLTGIRAARPLAPGVMLVRPLLAQPRKLLEDAAHAAGWAPLTDPSNTNPRHDRTHVRALLAREPVLLPASALAASAAHLAADEAVLDWAAARAWEGRVTITTTGLALDLAGLPQALQLRLLARAFAHFDTVPRGTAMARLLARGGGTLAGLRLRKGLVWTLVPAPARQNRP
jgi:tRNA(Ile)-lysidine synthase